ncbi:LysR family transcriptional regulator [Silvimonas sp. JCM 19000]
MLETRQLQYFVALADTLHFGRAAEQLHMTQPPLSRQIAALEQQLGVRLLVRNSRSVALTTAGRRLHAEATQILAALAQAERVTRSTAQGELGEIRVSFTMAAAWNVLPTLLKTWQHGAPGITVTLREVTPDVLADALARGETDLAITFPWRQPSLLHYQSLFKEPLCAVLPAAHTLAQQSTLDVRSLAAEPFITFPREVAPALYDAVFGCCMQHGFAPRIQLETRLQQTIVNLVAEGLGVALVPASMRKMQLAGAVFIPLADSPEVELGLSWSAHNDNPCLPVLLALTPAPS